MEELINIVESPEVSTIRLNTDAIATIRTIWWLTHMATCIFIILNAIANHGWDLI